LPESDVARLFGAGFVAALAELEPGRWAGPVESGYGLHVVLLRARVDGRLPALAEVRAAVEREWLAARRKEMVETAYRRLRDRYQVVVEPPVPDGDTVAAR
jgi:parvulin-like peptidyl-prolyl isomerase